MREVHTTRRTAFPEDVSPRGLGFLLFGLSRYQINSAPASRYVSVPLFLLAVLWSTGLMPSRWVGTALFALAWASFVMVIWRFRRRNYVRFVEGDGPLPTPERLTAGDSIPIWATGRFTVEGKYGRFTFLPGYYRTFATGEHAVLCLVRDRRFLRIARWPSDDLGMWYAFISPDRIRHVSVGNLTFGSRPSSAVAIDYDLVIPASNNSNREEVRPETLYLVCEDENERRQLVADLLCNRSETTRSGAQWSQPVKT